MVEFGLDMDIDVLRKKLARHLEAYKAKGNCRKENQYM